MPPRNYKCIIMGRNRAGIERAFACPNPSLDVAFGLLNQFLSFTTLSRRNILWAAGYVQKLREHPKWLTDIEAQKKIDRLDECVASAKARLQRRKEKRERLEEAALPKVDRRLKTAPAPPPEPAVDPSEIWARALEERK